MAWAQNDLTVLESAIAQGALTVKYADKEVTYRSLDDMLKLRELMKSEINGSGSIESSRRVGVYNKGI